jgi:O-antigen ligase/tetratricopeptide (TPR) repeat protein
MNPCFLRGLVSRVSDFRARRGSGGGLHLSGPTLARWLRRAVLAIGVAGLLVLPQFTSNASFIGIQGLPGPLAVVFVGFVFWLMPILLMTSWVAEGRATLPHPWVAIPAGLMVAGCIISTLAAADKSSAMVRAAEISGLWIGALALVQSLRTDAERRFLVAALVAAALVAALAAVYQAVYALPETWKYFQAHRMEVLAQHGIEPDSWGEQVLVGRFFGGVQATLGHPNVLASFLTLGLLAALGLVREKWSEAGTRGARGLAVAMAGAAIVCAVGIILAQARAAMVAGLVGIYWMAVRAWVSRSRLRRALYALPLVLGAAALAAAVWVDHPAATPALASLKVRLDYWRATWEVLRRHALTGVGLENFGLYYLEFKLPTTPEEVGDPHNILLSILSSLGLAGLAGLAGIWGIAIRKWLCSRTLPSRLAEACPPGGGAGAPPVEARKEEAAGESLVALLAPAILVAAPGMILFSIMGHVRDWTSIVLFGMFSAGAVTATVLAMGMAAAEEPSRLRASGRPFKSLQGACVIALLAFALQEMIGTAVLEPPTAWAMLVLLGVTLGKGDEEGDAARRGRRCRQPMGSEQPEAPRQGVALGAAGKFLLMAAAMVVGFLYTTRLLLPVGHEEYLIGVAAASADPAEQDEALRSAATADPLAWEPAMMRARLWQDEAGLARDPRSAIALEHARDAYDDALARQPRLRRAYLNLAACRLATDGALEDKADLAAARDDLGHAVRLYPTSLLDRLWLADVLDRLGARAEAAAAYREVLRLDGLMPEPMRRLADVVRRSVETRVKELEAGSAAPPYPDDFPIRLDLARAMDGLGNAAAAYWAYREVLRLDDRLAESRRLPGDFRRAIEERAKQLKESVAAPAAAP